MQLTRGLFSGSRESDSLLPVTTSCVRWSGAFFFGAASGRFSRGLALHIGAGRHQPIDFLRECGWVHQLVSPELSLHRANHLLVQQDRHQEPRCVGRLAP